MQRRRRSSNGNFHGYAMSWDLEFLEMIPLKLIFFPLVSTDVLLHLLRRDDRKSYIILILLSEMNAILPRKFGCRSINKLAHD
jgi:hypothetical protein